VHRRLILDWIEKSRLPAIYMYTDFVELGGLMSYEVDRPGMGRQAVITIDQIFKGANSSEIPISQPSKYELSINLKRQNVSGLTYHPHSSFAPTKLSSSSVWTRSFRSSRPNNQGTKPAWDEAVSKGWFGERVKGWWKHYCPSCAKLRRPVACAPAVRIWRA
jgi:hypothetical protein